MLHKITPVAMPWKNGRGVTEQIAIGGQRVLPLAPFRFSGDEPTSASLLEGPVRDYNVVAVGAVDEDRMEVGVEIERGPRPLGHAESGGSQGFAHGDRACSLAVEPADGAQEDTPHGGQQARVACDQEAQLNRQGQNELAHGHRRLVRAVRMSTAGLTIEQQVPRVCRHWWPKGTRTMTVTLNGLVKQATTRAMEMVQKEMDTKGTPGLQEVEIEKLMKLIEKDGIDPNGKLAPEAARMRMAVMQSIVKAGEKDPNANSVSLTELRAQLTKTFKEGAKALDGAGAGGLMAGLGGVMAMTMLPDDILQFVAGKKGGSVKELDKVDAKRTIKIAAGETATIKLQDKPGAGYRWHIVSTPRSVSIKESNKPSPAVGGPSEHSFAIDTSQLKAGDKFAVSLAYGRGSTNPTETLRFKFVVT